MAIKTGDIAITGTHREISCYVSHGRNIIRKASSLTANRVKEDAAFAGFRKSSNRMKEASSIAASLYNLIPGEKKEFSLYRLLTGEAIKMIRDGISTDIITQTLHDKYIIPVLEFTVAAEQCSDRGSELKAHSPQHKIRVPAKDPALQIQPSKEKISSSTSDLIYLGRVKGQRKLKIWLRREEC